MSYHNEVVNCTEPSPSVRVPCTNISQIGKMDGLTRQGGGAAKFVLPTVVLTN